MSHHRRSISSSSRIGGRCLALLLPLLAALLPQASAQTVVDSDLEVTSVVSGLSGPTGMVFISDDTILVTQKANGQVRRVTGGVLQAGAVLDVAVNATSERGLLGITRDPDFIHNGYIYLYYTESGTGSDGGTAVGNRVYRYTWNGSALVDPLLILDLPVNPGPSHDGGIIDFGPDDQLYVIIGDLNRNGKLENFPEGADPDDTGVILRVGSTGQPRVDNPFYDPANPDDPLNSYYAYGVRNSFGMNFDPVSGDVWDTENGPSTYDEINRFEPGANSGWERIMGPDARDPDGVEDLWFAPGAFYADPQFSWFATTAPTALAFAESRVMGCSNVHQLFVGDTNCRQLYRFELNAERTELVFSDPLLDDKVADNGAGRCSDEQSSVVFGTNFGIVTDIENGPDGALYVLSLTTGNIFRIGPKAGEFPDADVDGVNDRCDCDIAESGAFAPPIEVPRLRLSLNGNLALGWDSQAAVAGDATGYTVVSGELSSLLLSNFAGACELASDLVAPQTVDARMDPPPGEGYYYLVRAANTCGHGGYGQGTLDPDPREELDALQLPSCP